ncbi:hypothetical protein NHX12_011606 [Muraenolepis orangiensis]|uniref:PDZ domain-containing protein n=1 Tax=Muraenolepis orangiensis TaxID=630683 RepID=A0A9Q0I5V7_9TELE|nr:hypothetical protein NHX12_011606 [Muraenolepis orangiensis]
MDEEEETREVLFPDWEGPDKTGLTIEQSNDGEIFVKEVKEESAAGRSGRVHEGDQIVGATIYFDNMSSEDTAELLKTLNRHKVGLKLQNRGDKSPGRSPMSTPLSTPCRSPMGTLTWEGKSRFGGSSPDIVLSGDDEDYKRIYTKKIKPRLKSEDLAEGVDVRTERHSSTSSDGSTITTITRRITTYTVDMPGGISEQSELSSPEVKGLRYGSGEGSPYCPISHGSPSGKDGAEEGVFELGNVSLTTPQVSSTETHWSTGGLKTTTSREIEEDGGLRLKGPQFAVSGGKGQGGLSMSRGHGEHGDGIMHTGIKHVTIGGSEGVEMISSDGKGASIDVSLPGKMTRFSPTSVGKVEGGDVDISFGKGKTSVSDITIGQHRTVGSGHIGLSSGRSDGGLEGGKMISSDVKGGSIDVSLPGSITHFSSTSVGKVEGGDVDISFGKGKTSVSDITIGQHRTVGSGHIGLSSGRSDGGLEGGKMISSDVKGGSIDVSLPGSITHFSSTSVGKVEGGDVDISFGKGKTSVSDITIGQHRTAGSDRIQLSSERSDGTSIDNKKMKKDDKSQGPEIDKLSISGPQLSMFNVESNLKGPKIKLISHNVDISGPKIEGDIKTPKGTIEAPDVDIQGPEGGFKIPKMNKSSFGIKGPKIEGPEVDIDLPKADIDIQAPAMGIKGPQINIDDPHGNLKGSTFKMPSISLDSNLKEPMIKGGVDVSVPKIEGDLKSPNIEAPDVDIEGPGGFKMPNIRMPSFGFQGPKIAGPEVGINVPKADIDISGPKMSMPGMDFNLKGPKLKGDVDVSVPKIKGDLKSPKVEIEAQDVDIEIPGGGFKMPKIKMPTLGFKGSKIEAPEVDINIPKADIDNQGPKLAIQGPGIDVEGPDGNIKGPKFKMPSISGSHINMPDIDFNLKGRNLKGDVDLSVPTIKGDIKTPKGEIEGPEIDIEGPDGKIKGSKFKMPTISGPKMSMPDMDFNLKGSRFKGDVDVSVPKIKGDLKSPKVEIEGPDVDIEGPGGGFKMPKMKMPSFGFKGPNIEGPEVDIDLPKADIDIKAPNIGFEGPEIDIEGPDGKIKGSKFKMPTISGPKMSMPDMDFNLKGSRFKGDVDVSVPKIKGDLKSPKVEIEGPDVDIEGPGGGFKMPKMKMPSFGFKGPNIEGPEVDIDLPKADIDIKAPNIGFEGPEIDIEGPDGKIKGSKFKMPTISGPKMSMPDMDFNLKGSRFKGDVDVSVPKIKGDLKSPKVEIEGPDVDIEGPGGGFKMPKMKMPSFGFKGPNIEGPEVDIDLPKADIQAPNIGFEGPEIDIEGPDGKIKGSKFKMPSISGPHINLPDMDFNLKGPKLKGDVDLSVPTVKGDLKTPKVKIEGSKFEGPEVDIDLPKADIDIQAPNIGFEGPEIDIEGPDGKIKGSKFKMPSISGPHITMPDMDFKLKGPKPKGDVDVSVPTDQRRLKTPKVKIEGPDVDIEGPEVDLKCQK